MKSHLRHNFIKWKSRKKKILRKTVDKILVKRYVNILRPSSFCKEKQPLLTCPVGSDKPLHMELKKIEFLTISFIFFLHALAFIVVARIFQPDHPIYATSIVVFSFLSFFYLVCNNIKDFFSVDSTILLLLPAIIYMAFIFSISSVPRSGIGVGLPTAYFHILEYFILSFLSLMALNKGLGPNIGRAKILIVFFGCLIYALSDEFHQYFVPGRHTSLTDIVCDLIGIILGLTAFQLYRTTIISRSSG